MERRSRIVLTLMAFVLIGLCGFSFWTTVLRLDLKNSEVSNISYSNAKVVNTVTGELDLSVEGSDELTIKTVNTNAYEQVCTYSLIYSADSFENEFYVTINGEDILIETNNAFLLNGSYSVESNSNVENTFTVSSFGNTGIVKITDIECSIVE